MPRARLCAQLLLLLLYIAPQASPWVTCVETALPASQSSGLPPPPDGAAAWSLCEAEPAAAAAPPPPVRAGGPAAIEWRSVLHSFYNTSAGRARLSGHVATLPGGAAAAASHFSFLPPLLGCGGGAGATVAALAGAYTRRRHFSLPASPPSMLRLHVTSTVLGCRVVSSLFAQLSIFRHRRFRTLSLHLLAYRAPSILPGHKRGAL